VPPSAAYLLTDRLWLMLVLRRGDLDRLEPSQAIVVAIAMNVSIGGMMAVMTGVFLIARFPVRPALWPDRAGRPAARTAARQ
jgi:manganese/zinc/iron transport system permease protein